MPSGENTVRFERVMLPPGGTVMFQLMPEPLSSLIAQSHVFGNAVWPPIQVQTAS